MENKDFRSLVESYSTIYENVEEVEETVEVVEEIEEIEEAQQAFPFKKVEGQMEKARKGSVYGRNTGNKPSPQVSDSEKESTRRFSKMHQTYEKAKRAKQEKDKASRSSTFYRDTHPASAPKMKKANEEIEMFDLILAHLLDEGYASTEENALAIMSNMSEEWRQEILEAFVDPEHGETPSGRSPLQNVSDHPKASVRKKAVKGFKKQMSKEYGGQWKSRTDDPVREEVVSEGPEDRLRDQRMERGGVDGNVDYRRPAKSGASKPVDKKKHAETSKKAVDLVRQSILAKYGKGSLM